MDIRLLNVSKEFDQKKVLENIDICFIEGKINCIMGASGIGKTTIIHILLGLIEPDSGIMEGIQNKKLAAVFQEDRLIEQWNAIKNIQIVNDKLGEEYLKKELHLVGLGDDLNKPVVELSGGMRRRVAILRALLADSDIVIMDEPFKGLDERLKKYMLDYVKLKTEGKTVILVTHDIKEVIDFDANLITLRK